MNDRDDKFNENVCRVLDQSVDDFGADIEFKIGRLKYQALSTATSKKPWRPIWGSVFMTAALLLIVIFNVPQNRQIQMAAPDFSELDILSAKESLDFYAEDIEFYEWLSEVLENEPDFSGVDTAVPANSDSKNTFSTRERRDTLAQSGTDRVSWSIRG